MARTFALGRLASTPRALEGLERAGQSPQEFLARHLRGDWGDLSAEDCAENDFAIDRGLRLLSSYSTTKGEEIWVIRARSVVQVHPGPPFKSPLNTRRFSSFPFRGISLKKPFCQPFVNFRIDRMALHSGC